LHWTFSCKSWSNKTSTQCTWMRYTFNHIFWPYNFLQQIIIMCKFCNNQLHIVTWHNLCISKKWFLFIFEYPSSSINVLILIHVAKLIFATWLNLCIFIYIHIPSWLFILGAFILWHVAHLWVVVWHINWILEKKIKINK